MRKVFFEEHEETMSEISQNPLSFQGSHRRIQVEMSLVFFFYFVNFTQKSQIDILIPYLPPKYFIHTIFT